MTSFNQLFPRAEDGALWYNFEACTTMQSHFANEPKEKEPVQNKSFWNPQIQIWICQRNLIFISMLLGSHYRNMRRTNRRVNEALNGELPIAPIIGFRPRNTWAIDAKTRIFIFVIIFVKFLSLSCLNFFLVFQLSALSVRRSLRLPNKALLDRE